MAAWFYSACRGVASLVVLCMFELLLSGCTGSSADGDVTMPAVEHSVPIEAAQLPNYDDFDPEDDPRQLSFSELIDGPGSQELGASKLLREIGAMALLDSYIINIPPTAESIAAWDLTTGWVANIYHHKEAEPVQQAVGDFEDRILSAALSALRSLAQNSGPQQLHEAFFATLEQCAHGSPWPEVDLFEMHDGRGYDVEPHLIESKFGLTYFEYQQLRHQCARYAATYPTLEPTVRDELLAPQRSHYAHVILDRLDNEVPLVKIPDRYRDEVDDLRANGW